MKLKSFIFILLINFFSNLNGFKNLTEAQEYAIKHPEFPQSDNYNIENLDYSSFYKSLVPSIWDKFLIGLGLKRPLVWDSYEFLYLLEKVTKNRIKKYVVDDFGQLLELNKNSKIILWGDLHGAFHSFVRCLTELSRQNIINQDFKIIQPNTYLVFNGNLVDLGPYSMQLLTLVFNLMQANPELVFYIKGNHESKDKWKQYSLATELKILAANVSDEFIPLESLINRFFGTLPLGLFVKLEDSDDLIVISYFSAYKDLYNKIICDKSKSVNQFCKQIPVSTQFKAIIKGNDPVREENNLIANPRDLPNYKYGYGLYRLKNIDNAVVWTTISCPIQLYRMKYNFAYDSYVILNFESNIKSATIRDYFNNQCRNFCLNKGSLYGLTTGQMLEKGMNPETISPFFRKDLFRTLDKKQLLLRLEFIKKRINLVSDRVDSIKSDLKNRIEKQKLKLDNKPIPNLGYGQSIIKKLLNTEFTHKHEIYKAIIAIVSNFDEMVNELEIVEQVMNVNKLEVKKQKLTPAPAVQPENKIILGFSGPLTKTIKNVGIPMQTGLSLCATPANKLGKVNNKFIDIIDFDDEYIPYKFAQNIKKIFYDYQTRLLILPVGTPTILYALNFINKNNMFVFFPQSGAQNLRKSELKNFVHYRASYADEGRALIDHLLKVHSVRNFLLFYEDNSFGKSFLIGTKEIFDKNNIKDWAEIPYKINTILLDDEVEKIKKINPTAIGFFSNGPIAIRLIRKLGIEFLSGKILFGGSTISDNVTMRIMKNRGLKVLVTQLVPDPVSSNLEIVKEYREKLVEYGKEPNVFSLEGYIVMSILLDQISKIKDPITGQKIMNQIESINNYNFKGLKLNFDPENRLIGKSIWLRTADDKWIEKNIKTLEEYIELPA